jgi:ribosomal protein L11 methyltransferase
VAWQRVEVVVAGAHAEALDAALEAAGALATDIADADAGTEREHALFAEPAYTGPLWTNCRVGALLSPDCDAAAVLDGALAACGIEALATALITRVEDADWVAQTQRQFAPIRAGERLWIVPTWHEPPDPHAVNLVLDPGAAFGTGSHSSTRLCLAWLEGNVRPGDRVLDYGCGSGILAIAALKLGAASACAVDIDPQALEAARYNSRHNGVALEVVDAQAALPGAYRIVIANILANPLRMLAPVLAAHTAPGGALALSGILEAQAGEVIAAYGPWLRLEVAASEAGWVLLAGAKGP